MKNMCSGGSATGSINSRFKPLLALISCLLVFVASSVSAQPTDEQIAESRAAASKGEAWAQYNLGVMYDNGYGGVPEDDAVAVKWYTKAAEQGNSRAQYNLVVMQEGVPASLLSILAVMGVYASRPLGEKFGWWARGIVVLLWSGFLGAIYSSTL